MAWGAVHLNSDTLNELAKLVDNGQLQPVVDKIFSPRDVELAFQHTDSAQAIGKTVIRFRYLLQGFISLFWSLVCFCLVCHPNLKYSTHCSEDLQSFRYYKTISLHH